MIISVAAILFAFPCITAFHAIPSHHNARRMIAMNNLEIGKTKLGNSNLLVSDICLGTMTWGQQNTEEEGIEQLNLAFKDYGINFLDTAEMYPVPTKAETSGRTDLCVGKWLKTMKRDEVILATKVAGPGISWLAGRDGEGSRLSASQITVSVDESLKRLGTDYIDLLQIHWPDRYVPIFGRQGYNTSLERDAISFEEQLTALDKLVKSGKVRHIGVSNESPFGVMKFSQVAKELGLSKMVTIQNSYSLLVRHDFENGLAEVCSPRNENVGLLAYSPLAGGILTGKYAKPDCPSTARLNLFEGYMARYKQSLAQTAVAEYAEIAKSVGITPAELALAWCYKQPHVASTIIGGTSIPQLMENINAYGKINMIDDDVSGRINDVYKRFKDPAMA